MCAVVDVDVNDAMCMKQSIDNLLAKTHAEVLRVLLFPPSGTADLRNRQHASIVDNQLDSRCRSLIEECERELYVPMETQILRVFLFPLRTFLLLGNYVHQITAEHTAFVG